MTSQKPLSGIIVPMITPLTDHLTLDYSGLERLIEHILDGYVHGLFILGTTGEGPSLGNKLRIQLIERVCDQVDGRVPVLVGISDTSVTESLKMATNAARSGAYAVVATPPYYYPIGQSDLINYFDYLGSHLDLPMFLYNMPSHARYILEPETVKTIAENENIIGLKDSSANIVYLQKMITIMKGRPDFSLTIGPEEGLMQSILAGANGGVNGGANMFPRLYVSMYEAAVARDFERMIPLQKLIMEISSSIYSVDRTGSSYLRGLKTALALMGICNDFLSEPLRQMGQNDRSNLGKNLNTLITDLSSEDLYKV
jgi:4-hydroxy-tetrahydrodipicolinate synthase